MHTADTAESRTPRLCAHGEHFGHRFDTRMASASTSRTQHTFLSTEFVPLLISVALPRNCSHRLQGPATKLRILQNPCLVACPWSGVTTTLSASVILP
eukprot:IDg15206t1